METKNNIKLAQQRWNMKILYVDGNIYMRQTLKNMLNSLGYQNIQAASDKFQAEEYIEKTKIELIIADKSINALDLLMTVRKNKKIKRIPFILTASDLQQEELALAAEFDVTHTLLKPYDVNKLREAILKSFKNHYEPDRKRELFEKAEDMIEQSNPAELLNTIRMIDELTTISKGRISNYKLVYLKVYYYFLMGLHDNAKDLIFFVTDEHPKWIKLFDLLAEIYVAENNLEDAFKTLQKTIKISPYNIERVMNIVKIAEKLKLKNEVIQYIETIADKILDLKDEDVKFIVKKFFQYKKFEDVVKIYNKIKRFKHKDKLPLYLYVLASDSYFNLNEFDKAVDLKATLLSKYSKKSAIYPDLMKEYYEMLKKTGKENDAKIILNKMQKMFPDFVAKNFHHKNSK